MVEKSIQEQEQIKKRYERKAKELASNAANKLGLNNQTQQQVLEKVLERLIFVTLVVAGTGNEGTNAVNDIVNQLRNNQGIKNDPTRLFNEWIAKAKNVLSKGYWSYFDSLLNYYNNNTPLTGVENALKEATEERGVWGKQAVQEAIKEVKSIINKKQQPITTTSPFSATTTAVAREEIKNILQSLKPGINFVIFPEEGPDSIYSQLANFLITLRKYKSYNLNSILNGLNDEQRQEVNTKLPYLSEEEKSALLHMAAYGGYAKGRAIYFLHLLRNLEYVKALRSTYGSVQALLNNLYGPELGEAVYKAAEEAAKSANCTTENCAPAYALAIVGLSLTETVPIALEKDINRKNQLLDLYKNAVSGSLRVSYSYDNLIKKNPHLKQEVKEDSFARISIPGIYNNQAATLHIYIDQQQVTYEVEYLQDGQIKREFINLESIKKGFVYRGEPLNIEQQNNTVTINTGFDVNVEIWKARGGAPSRIGRFRLSFNNTLNQISPINYDTFEATRGDDIQEAIKQESISKVKVNKPSQGLFQNTETTRLIEQGTPQPPPQFAPQPPPSSETTGLTQTVKLQRSGKELTFSGFLEQENAASAARPPAIIMSTSFSALGINEEEIDLNDQSKLTQYQTQIADRITNGSLPSTFYRRIIFKNKPNGEEIGVIPVGKRVDDLILSAPAIFIKKDNQWYKIEAKEGDRVIDIQEGLIVERAKYGDTVYNKYSIVGVDETSIFKLNEKGELEVNNVTVENGRLKVNGNFISREGVTFTMTPVSQPSYEEVSHSFIDQKQYNSNPLSYFVMKKGDEYIVFSYYRDDNKVFVINHSTPEGLENIINGLGDGLHIIIFPSNEVDTLKYITTPVSYFIVPPKLGTLLEGPYILNKPAPNFMILDGITTR